MRIWIITGMASLLSVTAAAEPEPQAPIARVTVFADRAEITRTTTARCHGDHARVPFPPLPPSIDVRTLRATASGKAEAIGATSRMTSLATPRQARAVELAAELQGIERRAREVLERAEGLEERKQAVGRYGEFFRSLLTAEVLAEEPDIPRWTEVLDLLRRERLSAGKGQSRLAGEVRMLNRKRELAERWLEILGPGASKRALEVGVSVACNGESQPEVSLSYVVPGATWSPEYDLDFTPAGSTRVGAGQAALTVSAVVRQNTGEDWTDVSLVLSTARPRLGAQAPLPERITLRGREAGEEKVLLDVMEKRDRLAVATPSAAPPTATLSSGLQISDRGRAFALEVPRRVTVRSDGRSYWMPVDRLEAAATSALVSVPRLSRHVYRVARLDNPASYPLLDGRVHAYHAGSHVGVTALEYAAPGAPLEISLGIDGELTVWRKDLRRQDHDGGAFSSTRKLERAYRITLRNGARSGLPVEVQENIPVSKVEDVRVKLLEPGTTPGYELDAHRGLLSWTVNLAPGTEQSLELGYRVHLPEDWEVRLR